MFEKNELKIRKKILAFLEREIVFHGTPEQISDRKYFLVDEVLDLVVESKGFLNQKNG